MKLSIIQYLLINFKEIQMKKILLSLLVYLALVNAHQYDVYDINGKKIGVFKENLNKQTFS